jgi:carbon-monoxide dehydrogenase medium subunit
VKPSPFTYYRPYTLDEALEMLASLGESGKVLAGGQSLVPLMSMRLAAPPCLVDLNYVRELDTVQVSDADVRVGAMARHAAVERDEAAYSAIPLLRQGLRNVAHPTIRNRGTTVGSIVHADPAAEMPAVLTLLDGQVELRSADGGRTVGAAEFILGPMETSLRTAELAVAATFPRPPVGSGSAFLELARRQGDYAMCGVAALVTTDRGQADGDGGDPAGAVLTTAKVALVSVGAGPVLVDVTPAIDGAGFDEAVLRDLVDPAIDPETDIHATADYRRHLAHVLTARALSAAQAHAEGGSPREH